MQGKSLWIFLLGVQLHYAINQKDFDGSKIQYSDEYYEVTGIENPKGTNTQDKHLVEFEPVVFEFNRKQDSD